MTSKLSVEAPARTSVHNPSPHAELRPHHAAPWEKSPSPEIRLSSFSVPRREGPGRGHSWDTYRDLILDLAAHIPLRPHGTLAPHHTREEKLLRYGHPGEKGSKQGLRGSGDWLNGGLEGSETEPRPGCESGDAPILQQKCPLGQGLPCHRQRQLNEDTGSNKGWMQLLLTDPGMWVGTDACGQQAESSPMSDLSVPTPPTLLPPGSRGQQQLHL